MFYTAEKKAALWKAFNANLDQTTEMRDAIVALVGEESETLIDLDMAGWHMLLDAASQSQWMPQEYAVNDWLADCAQFLRVGYVGQLPSDPENLRHVMDDVNTHRLAWMRVFDLARDAIKHSIKDSHGSDLDYVEHERRALLRLLNAAGGLGWFVPHMHPDTPHISTIFFQPHGATGVMTGEGEGWEDAVDAMAYGLKEFFNNGMQSLPEEEPEAEGEEPAEADELVDAADAAGEALDKEAEE